ncbi:plastid movement impaired 2, WEAK CHLOROPLAST MOVEMENT UNDER BLUE LIGHT 2 [Hibiscus trionum]|uniref:Plastid movement impaired 2, WEAK CHLOROPLAST MOVEMENT UNDER BLUE LIGHT 2 n=1 Tax=Hibiscus trionum TaxID=183268 RepID=A0A9W7GWJ4_HIBTR|nr:plastid movement impaired 2, WEAK CHLOROPLAST MOVEMENT UNDER BLUE LIGHT 2 [Hibiscus trionum]
MERKRIGSSKAAENMYGGMILEGSSSLEKPQNQEAFPEKPLSKAKELHIAKMDMSRYKESRRNAESAKFKAESELFSAKKTVKDLASMIEESNFKAKERIKDVESLKTKGKLEEKASVFRRKESYLYAEVMKELEMVKHELSELKLEMASVMADKARAVKDYEDSSSKMMSNGNYIKELRKEIEAANEEHVLVELARIEASKEAADIKAQKEKEVAEFAYRMEETQKKMKDMVEEMDRTKELEQRLDVTLSDINLSQDKLKQVRDQTPSSESINKELQAAKNELASIREESFRYMSSMDVIRNELKRVTEETEELKKTDEKTDLRVKSLNSKLLRAKSKLEAVTAAEEKTKSIVTNLSLTLEQLRTEAEASKKEKALVTEDIAKIEEEIRKTESEIDSTEEKLQAAVEELEAVKSAETSALEQLRSLIETTMQSRASASNQNSTITISKFEYEYLTGRAVGAEEIADKKVAAAQAWIEALKASEREILMKTETARRDLRETRVEEEHEAYRTERSLSAKKMIEKELRNWQNVEGQNKQSPLNRKSRKSNGNLTPLGRSRFRGLSSPVTRVGGSTPFIIKKKRRVIPNLAKIFTGKKVGKDA